uniref:Ring finger protein 32 n=1 Tax=Sinocyclocheilus anshuiensis TaxID=1608454 RepID=A0A671NJG5_9TELE
CPAACGAALVSSRHKNHNTRQRVIYLEQPQGEEEREYVLDRGPPPLTLAQRMGLVVAPSRRLTAEEWAEVKTRSIQEGDSTQPCVICREEFHLQPQVTAPSVCLKSFEKFSGRKSCPMCRKEQYETRGIYDAARLYRKKCAVRIQAFWRGYLVRKWYSNMNLVQSCSTDVEAFLNDIDRSVATSHDILRRFDNKYMSVSEMEEKDWLEAQEKVCDNDCPICLNHLGSNNSSSKEDRNAFELFCHKVKPTCPLCRSHYAKMLVSN